MNRLRNAFELWGVTGLVLFSVWLLLPGVSWGLFGVLWNLGPIGKSVAIVLVAIAVIGIVGWIVVEGVAYLREWAWQFRLWRLGIEERAEVVEEETPAEVIARARAEWRRLYTHRRSRFFRGTGT